MPSGEGIRVKTRDGKSLRASIVHYRQKVYYKPILPEDLADMFQYCPWMVGPRWIVVEDEVSVVQSPSDVLWRILVAHMSPMLMIQYAPGWPRRLSALAFVDFVRKLLGCLDTLDLGIAKKGDLSPPVEKLIEAYGLLSNLYTRRSLAFRQVPILVLMDRPNDLLG
jgi:hypothetical protein